MPFAVRAPHGLREGVPTRLSEGSLRRLLGYTAALGAAHEGTAGLPDTLLWQVARCCALPREPFEVGRAQLSSPWGLAVDRRGRLYVCDTGNHRVLRWDDPFDPQAEPVVVAGAAGRGVLLDQLDQPIGVAVLDDGTLYVSEQGNNRVLRFDPSEAGSARCGEQVAGDLNWPQHIAVDATTGDLYIADYLGQSVLKWPAGGDRGVKVNEQRSVGLTLTPDGQLLVALLDGAALQLGYGETRATIAGENGGPAGTIGGTRLNGCWGVCVDPASGDVFVACSMDNAVRRLCFGGDWGRRDGPVLDPFSIPGPVNGSTLSRPTSVAVHDGHLFVADLDNHRVVVVPLDLDP